MMELIITYQHVKFFDILVVGITRLASIVPRTHSQLFACNCTLKIKWEGLAWGHIEKLGMDGPVDEAITSYRSTPFTSLC